MWRSSCIFPYIIATASFVVKTSYEPSKRMEVLISIQALHYYLTFMGTAFDCSNISKASNTSAKKNFVVDL